MKIVLSQWLGVGGKFDTSIPEKIQKTLDVYFQNIYFYFCINTLKLCLSKLKDNGIKFIFFL